MNVATVILFSSFLKSTLQTFFKAEDTILTRYIRRFGGLRHNVFFLYVCASSEPPLKTLMSAFITLIDANNKGLFDL